VSTEALKNIYDFTQDRNYIREYYLFKLLYRSLCLCKFKRGEKHEANEICLIVLTTNMIKAVSLTDLYCIYYARRSFRQQKLNW
jgi:hypothetical protein